MTSFCIRVEFELYCPSSFSLKDKRRVVTSLSDNLKNNYNVAVAEVEHQEHHRLAGLSVVSVSSSRKHLISLKDKLLRELDSRGEIQVRNIEDEIY